MSNQTKKNSEGFLSSLIGEKTPSKTAGLTYTVSALAIFGVSFLLLLFPLPQEGEFFLYLNYLAAPIAFFLTGFWYFSYTKSSLKAFIKEQKCPWKYYLIAILLQVGLLSLTELNNLFLEFLGRFGYKPSELQLPNMQGAGFIGVLFTVAVLPAIMEEFLFRGIFLRETKDFSLWVRVLLCGGLFALYHQNPAQTLYQFCCGAAFALVAFRAGSILPTIISHFINNALILTLTKFGVTSFPMPVFITIMIVSGVCLVGSLVWLIFFDKQQTEIELSEEEKKQEKRRFWQFSAAGIAVYALTWLSVLLSGL